MKSYEITNMIIDDDFYGEESVTADFTHKDKQYSVTFNKSDLELVNSWVFEENRTIPANLPDVVIDSLREDIKRTI
ncbi:hypothetical protein [Litchfieldia salsa]|uniref:Uncharacterized protein n=1 Tax=Litchfieldia salsa TaxID=930152 RepID=A0A1H0Q977_9BACI|nr:hypothetical protein [Litchfieldia salsa]SDP13874.1 hypothetical protein SAMN05216565_101660 [Litchfieldia salsa]